MPSSDGWDFRDDDGTELPAGAPAPSPDGRLSTEKVDGTVDWYDVSPIQAESDGEYIMASRETFVNAPR